MAHRELGESRAHAARNRLEPVELAAGRDTVVKGRYRAFCADATMVTTAARSTGGAANLAA